MEPTKIVKLVDEEFKKWITKQFREMIIALRKKAAEEKTKITVGQKNNEDFLLAFHADGVVMVSKGKGEQMVFEAKEEIPASDIIITNKPVLSDVLEKIRKAEGAELTVKFEVI